MKKFTITLFLLLVSFCFVLSGCSGSNLTMPQNYTQISSNGGFVIGCGDYLYFANAYQSYKNLEDKSDNDGSGVKQYSLKRAQKNGESLKTNDDDKIIYENVINKIAGYETSNMFVVNEYLYFTSPNVHKSDSKETEDYNQYEFNLSTLFRIKLDGSDFKELYTTEKDNAKIYLTGGQKQSILIYDDEKIMQIKCYENSKSITTLAEGVKSTVFPYDQGIEFVDIYFTADRDESDKFTGNVMKKLNIVTGEIKEVTGYKNAGETITLVSYNGKYLYYTRTGLKTKPDCLYVNDFSVSNSEKQQRFDASNFSNSSKLMIITSEKYDLNVFVFEYNNNIYVQNMSENTTGKKITTENSKIAFVDGTYIYYTTENGIYRVSALTHKIQQVSDIKDFNADLIDFDGRYVYFYAKVENASTSTQYLYRADSYACDLESVKTEIIAELLDEDVKAIEDSQNSEEE